MWGYGRCRDAVRGLIEAVPTAAGRQSGARGPLLRGQFGGTREATQSAIDWATAGLPPPTQHHQLLYA